MFHIFEVLSLSTALLDATLAMELSRFCFFGGVF